MKTILSLFLILIILMGCAKKNEYEKFNATDPEYIRPKITKKGSLIYADSVKAQGITGVVMVECTIDTFGTVIEKKVIKTTNKKLNESAIATVNQYKFESAIYGKKKIIHKLVIPVSFE